MRRWGAIACALWCLIAAAVIVVRVQAGRAIDTDIQSLLPQSALEPVIRAAMSQASNVASSRLEVLVAAETPERAAEAAAALERELTATGFFVVDSAGGADIGRWVHANRNALICETDPEDFDGARARAQALAMLYAPAAPISGEMLTHDPFLRTPILAQCLLPRGAAGAPANAVLLSGQLTQSAFRLDVQDVVTAAYDAWRASWPDVAPARAGALFYAAESAQKMRGEVSLIGGVSVVFVIAVLLIPFRRFSALIWTLAVTAAGALGSLGMALLVFPSVHMLVFVFGSALIGVTSDYALHCLGTGPATHWAAPRERVRRVFRPLLVCAGSTSLGFASLGLFGVALFNQVAVFAIAGVLTAWWFTISILPLVDRAPKNAALLASWWEKLDTHIAGVRWPRWATGASLAGLALICVVAALRFHFVDDVRAFQPLSPVLRAEEESVRAASGFSGSPRFLLSHGASMDEARQHEEAALAAIPEDERAAILSGARLDPSATRRAENARVLRERLYAPYLEPWNAMLGIEPEPFARIEAQPPALLSALSGHAGGQAFAIAPLGAARIDAAPSVANVVLVDPTERYSAAFASFRTYAAFAFVLAFAVCAAAIAALYRSPRALAILIGPAIGSIMAVAAPAALGMPASFFSICALFVVIGAGVDYSVFRYEAALGGEGGARLPVFLSMLTTIACMGLLALSSAYPVRVFGVSVAAGVTASYAFSFFAAHLARGRAA